MTRRRRRAADGAVGARRGRLVARCAACSTRSTAARSSCAIAGARVLALLSWYVAWHVPTSDVALREPLRRRVQGPPLPDQTTSTSVQHGGVLYSPQIDHAPVLRLPARRALAVLAAHLGRDVHRRAALDARVAARARLDDRVGRPRCACRWRWPKAWAVSLLVATPLSRARAAARRRAPRARPGRALPRGRRRRSTSSACATARARRAHRASPRRSSSTRSSTSRSSRCAASGARSATPSAAHASPRPRSPGSSSRPYSATYFFHRLLGGGELRHYWHNAHWISSSSSLYTLFFRQPFTGTPPERAIGLRAVRRGRSRLGVYAAWRQLREGREVGALLCVALASTIGSPVAWDHYFIWVVLVPFVLVERGRAAVVADRRRSGCFGLTCLVPLRLARNENLSHTAYDWIFVVIFTARNALTASSLLWLVVASIPWSRRDARRRRAERGRPSRRTTRAARGSAPSGVRPSRTTTASRAGHDHGALALVAARPVRPRAVEPPVVRVVGAASTSSSLTGTWASSHPSPREQPSSRPRPRRAGTASRTSRSCAPSSRRSSSR